MELLTSAAGGQLAPLLPWVDHMMIDQAMGRDVAGNRGLNAREEVAFVECLRQNNFSVALIFTSPSQSPLRAAYACYLAGIPYRIGFGKGMSSSLCPNSLNCLDIRPEEVAIAALEMLSEQT